MFSLFNVVWFPIIEHCSYLEAVKTANSRWPNCEIESGHQIQKVRGFQEELVGYILDTAETSKENV